MCWGARPQDGGGGAREPFNQPQQLGRVHPPVLSSTTLSSVLVVYVLGKVGEDSAGVVSFHHSSSCLFLSWRHEGDGDPPFFRGTALGHVDFLCRRWMCLFRLFSVLTVAPLFSLL